MSSTDAKLSSENFSTTRYINFHTFSSMLQRKQPRQCDITHFCAAARVAWQHPGVCESATGRAHQVLPQVSGRRDDRRSRKSQRIQVRQSLQAQLQTRRREKIRTVQLKFVTHVSCRSLFHQIFEDALPTITSCVDGYNVCIMAYGQTGVCSLRL